MNFISPFVLVTVSLCYHILPMNCQSDSNCAPVSPVTYNTVLLGQVRELFRVTKDQEFTLLCLHYNFYDLNAGNRTAKSTIYLEDQNKHGMTRNSRIILTERGLTFQAYVTSNINKYYSAMKTSCDVIVFTECPPHKEFVIGCPVNNCGSRVQEKAKILAEAYAIAYNMRLFPVSNADCTAIPY